MLRWVPVPTPPVAGISLFGAGTAIKSVVFQSVVFRSAKDDVFSITNYAGNNISLDRTLVLRHTATGE